MLTGRTQLFLLASGGAALLALVGLILSSLGGPDRTEPPSSSVQVDTTEVIPSRTPVKAASSAGDRAKPPPAPGRTTQPEAMERGRPDEEWAHVPRLPGSANAPAQAEPPKPDPSGTPGGEVPPGARRRPSPEVQEKLRNMHLMTVSAGRVYHAEHKARQLEKELAEAEATGAWSEEEINEAREELARLKDDLAQVKDEAKSWGEVVKTYEPPHAKEQQGQTELLDR